MYVRGQNGFPIASIAASLCFLRRPAVQSFWGEMAAPWVATTGVPLAKVIGARTIVELLIVPRQATREHLMTPAPVVTPMVI